ncbi:LuxR C-terminal-related transcriptional regulator [Pimelobacter simplex]|uniref:LuxR C-terminal-related transcriptional regulator n=1 Tax=Nocardioides simplex TaxID=2045 RepID=UPI003AABC420
MRVTIIDRHSLLADSLSIVLEREGFLVTIVETAHPQSSLVTVLASALRCAGRLVLMEQDLGRVGDGMRLVAPLTRSGATVVVLTESTDRSRWGRAVQQGAKDVLHKTCSLRQVVGTAQRVRDGLPLMDAAQRASLVAAAQAEHEEIRAIRVGLDRLTRRETQILGALMNGDTVREIARTHVVAEVTVRSQVKSILAKLEKTSQVAAVGAAHRVTWRPPTA